MKLGVSGAWKEAKEIAYGLNSTWKQVKELRYGIAGVWEKVWVFATKLIYIISDFIGGVSDGVEVGESGICLALPEEIDGAITDGKCYEVKSGETLIGTVAANAGDIVLATVSIRDSNPAVAPQGWTKLSDAFVYDAGSVFGYQRVAFFIKRVDTDGTISFTATQTNAGRIYLNLIALSGVKDIVDMPDMTAINDNVYVDFPVPDKPEGTAIIWGCTSIYWSTDSPYADWETNPNDLILISLDQSKTQPRLGNFVDWGQGKAINRTITSTPKTTRHCDAISAVKLVPKYSASGEYVSQELDLSPAVQVQASEISWDETTSDDTSITVQTSLSTDGGTAYGEWQTATTGGAIPGLTQGQNLEGVRLKWRAFLSTNDGYATPILHEVVIKINEAI